MGLLTIGPTSSELGESLAGRDVLVPSRTRDSCGGPGVMQADTTPGVQCFLRHIDEAGFRVKRALCQKSSAAWLGCVSEDARLSRVHKGVAAKGQD